MQYNTEFCYTRSTNRHRKELDNIKIQNCPKQEYTEEVICCVPEGTEPQDCTEEKTTFTLTEFKELVHSAQNGDREAINTLCNAFKPLIYKEAYRYEVREALGEDAINTAWLIFLEQIKKYKDRDFGHLPGLLQYHIHYGLLHKFTREKSVKDCYYLDAEEEGEETQIADKEDVFDRMEVNQLFSAARLSKEQTNAVNELVLNDLDHRVFCKKYACSSKTAFKHRANGLQKLKLLLA
ncbi:RNA polymerase sigma factor [Phascolarctobacterium succinatutens]|jgi:DNA-directed RNA polymerase specialized sigma24 family protein|uniref:RNA polymerase sigma factor n=1 Tax=Phascolarctobacterium succinatutens TaxID=626940 RepID=UPI0026EC0037|nr:sigma-70 family RNA polymerase sigma factor [Phascolarctobacterium succinatutens]